MAFVLTDRMIEIAKLRAQLHWFEGAIERYALGIPIGKPPNLLLMMPSEKLLATEAGLAQAAA